MLLTHHILPGKITAVCMTCAQTRGKERFMQLTAERVVGGYVSGISSIPVITHATAFPFLA
jgi:hypothetical protein